MMDYDELRHRIETDTLTEADRQLVRDMLHEESVKSKDNNECAHCGDQATEIWLR